MQLRSIEVTSILTGTSARRLQREVLPSKRRQSHAEVHGITRRFRRAHAHFYTGSAPKSCPTQQPQLRGRIPSTTKLPLFNNRLTALCSKPHQTHLKTPFCLNQSTLTQGTMPLCKLQGKCCLPMVACTVGYQMPSANAKHQPRDTERMERNRMSAP